MPQFRITSPEGVVYNITGPEGATEAQALEMLQQQLSAKSAPEYSPADVPWYENALAGAGAGMLRAGRAVSDLLPHASLGIANPDELIRKREEAAQKLEAPLMDTASGLTGNIAGSVASMLPLGMIPGAQTLAGATLTGAVGSALTTPGGLKERGVAAAVGGVGGAVGQTIGKAVSRVVKPRTSSEVTQLVDEGVPLTPGQIAGGVTKRIEEAATSIPFIGDVIKRGQQRAMEGFNRAAFNRALEPIGQKLPDAVDIGRDAVEYVDDALGKAYDALLPKLNTKLDQTFMSEITSLGQGVKNLPAEKAAQFDRILHSQLLDKFTQYGLMGGERMKEVESQLGRLARDYAHAADPDQRMLGNALREAQATLRRLVQRANPKHALELGKINEGWANYVRLQDAASRLGSKEGVFSPAQLRGATRAKDSSLRKGKFAKGDALMQDLAEAGESVIGRTVPDSGTPLRSMVAMGSAVPAFLLDPSFGVGLGAAGAAYGTPMGQKIAAALMMSRPPGADLLSKGLQYAGPLVGTSLGSSLLE